MFAFLKVDCGRVHQSFIVVTLQFDDCSLGMLADHSLVDRKVNKQVV